MKTPMTAVKLRVILVILLIVSILLGIGAFLFIRTKLVEKAADSAKTIADAASSHNRVQSLRDAEKLLQENAAVEAKARAMVADSRNYQYQTRLFQDVVAIGAQAGVQVSAVNFTAATPGSSAAPAATAAPTGTSATPANAALPGGLNLIKADVTVKGPLPYEKLITFISYLERNTMKMQVAKVGITSTSSGTSGGSQVNSEVFSIGVYIR